MEVREGGVGHIRDGKLGFETGPELEEGSRGRCEGTGGVPAVFDKIEVTAEEGIDGGVDLKHRTDEIMLKMDFAWASLEVDIKELERLVRGCAGNVAP